MLRQPPGTTALTSPYGEHIQRQRDVGNVVKDVEAPHGQLADTVTAESVWQSSLDLRDGTMGPAHALSSRCRAR
jgi:hypothetical protein